MATLEQVDLCLGESLEMLVTAAGEFKEYTSKNDFGDKNAILKNIGDAVSIIWHARNALYEKRPDLKRDFKKEYEENKQRYEDLDLIFMKARNFEKDGNFDEARKIYKELLEQSKFGYFKLLAQAGLYRCSK